MGPQNMFIFIMCKYVHTKFFASDLPSPVCKSVADMKLVHGMSGGKSP